MRDITTVICKIGNFVFSKTKMTFYEYCYNKEDLPQVTYEGITFKALPPRDVPDLEELLAVQRESESIFRPPEISEIEKRFIRGDGCYVCESQGKIIGYSWYATESKYIPEIRVTLILDPSDLYLYNSYIAKDFRRKNIVGNNLNTPSVPI